MIHDIYISLDDFKKVYQKKKRKIKRAAVFTAICSFLYFLLTPPTYESTATFKQSSSRQEASVDLKNLMRTFSAGPSESSTVPLMLSRSVLTKTIEALGLQATVPLHGSFVNRLIALRDNVLAELHLTVPTPEEFEFQEVAYAGEKPLKFFLRFTAPEKFELCNHSKQPIAQGCLSDKLDHEEIAFTLIKTPSSLKTNKFYPLFIQPTQSILEHVKKRCVVKPLREDKNILTLKYTDRNRLNSSAFINTLMTKYEEYLVEENKTVIGAQIDYLDQRRQELNTKLDVDIQNHVATLKQNLLEQGYMGIEEEITAILEPLQHYRQRINEIDVEIAGLEKQSLKAPKLAKQVQDNLSHQIEKNSLLLQNLEKEQLTANLQDFLKHLVSRQKNLEESASYLEKSETDFRGMTVKGARDLFQQYCLQLDDLHAQLKQVVFFRDHLHEPDFEISTLSNVLNDPVTQELVHKSSTLEAQLCDSITRSGREHERVKETLAIHKKFLESHLNQTLELGKIRILLFKEKIGSLSSVMKELLLQEKAVLETKIGHLKHNLQQIPELWHLDKRLKFKSELTKGMMEGLTQITESKNLSRHLYQVESKPLDGALTPLQPTSPRLLLKPLAFALGAATLFYLAYLISAFIRGLPLSLATLRLLGAHTSGSLSYNCSSSFEELSQSDLATLRNLTSFLKEKKGTLALLGKQSSRIFSNLAHLLTFYEKKLLFIDCNFDQQLQAHQLRHEKDCDFLSLAGSSHHAFEFLSSQNFVSLIESYKSKYDYIFLLCNSPLSSQESHQLLQLSDHSIVTTIEESQAVLDPYLLWNRQKDHTYATYLQYPIIAE